MTYGEPRYDAQGRVEAVIGASLDVTERVRADEALREREERLQRALADTVAALGATVAMRDPYTSATSVASPNWPRGSPRAWAGASKPSSGCASRRWCMTSARSPFRPRSSPSHHA